jgi:hypothetical protein
VGHGEKGKKCYREIRLRGEEMLAVQAMVSRKSHRFSQKDSVTKNVANFACPIHFFSLLLATISRFFTHLDYLSNQHLLLSFVQPGSLRKKLPDKSCHIPTISNDPAPSIQRTCHVS